jgi:lipoate-protein ligase A
MQRNRAALAGIVSNSEMQVRGHTDLTVGGLKFSGNAQRRRKHCLLFHGTFLLDFDIALIEKFLSMPSRQPAYRRNRAHADFLTNLGVSADAVKSAMQKTWQAHESPEGFPIERARLLASDKYVTKEWNCKF